MKPKILYHGSTTARIKVLEPRKRYTPSVLGKNVKPAVYAAADPAYAAGHGFSWSSDEGFDIYEYEGKVILEVPKKFAKRLSQKLYVYSLSSRYFKLLKLDSPKSRIYISFRKVEPLEVKEFENVRKAISFYGGKVVFC